MSCKRRERVATEILCALTVRGRAHPEDYIQRSVKLADMLLRELDKGDPYENKDTHQPAQDPSKS
jgi:hypothetical protein